ncbi:MAG: hypothetical protein IJ466_07705 [Clostridia bacterium]|nr:hypothetical protein [Clostridia bacterium]
MKKILAMVLSVAIVASLAITGTVAYLQAEDSAVNVMTMGEVKIDQIEQKRKNDGTAQNLLEPFSSGVKLYPAHYEGSSIPWAPETEWVKSGDQAWKVVQDNPNVVDKFITVENTGKTNAYVRTILAIEVGENGVNDPYVHLIHNGSNISEGSATWDWEWVKGDDGETAVVKINGAYYELYVGTYTGILESGKETIPSLKQVYMDKAATNEDVAKYGSSFEILALSQAVQANGFEYTADTELERAKIALNAAFGDITAAAHPWIEAEITIPVYVSNSKEVVDALKNGGDVNVTEDIDMNEVGDTAQVGSTTYKYTFGATGSDTDSTIDMGGNDMNLSSTGADGYTSSTIAYYVADGAKVTLKNVGKVNLTGAMTFIVCGGSELNIMDGEYTWNTTNKISPRIQINDTYGAVKDQSSTVNIYGGTFKFNNSSNALFVQNGDGSIKIYGGTFDCDVSSYVAENYQAVKTGTDSNATWTVSAKPASETPTA